MTQSDQHADQQLTRRQLREIRMTGATPVVSAEAAAEALAQSAAAQAEPATPEPIVEAPVAPATPPAPALHLPRAAEPIVETPAPAADASVDLGSRARTRRQARDQERIRTNSIPVVAPETNAPLLPFGTQSEAPAAPVVPHAQSTSSLFSPGAAPAVAEPAPMFPAGTPMFADSTGTAPAAEPVTPVASDVPLFAPVAPAMPAAEAPVVDDHPVLDDAPAADSAPSDIDEARGSDVAPASTHDDSAAAAESLWAPRSATGATSIPVAAPTAPNGSIAASLVTDEPSTDEPVVRADFGSALLTEGETFDDLLVRSSTSSGSAGSASMLILPEDMSLTPLTAPVTSTGQVILTGTFSLPEGLGSQGHAPGVADGKDVDAVLIDGELAPQSSPTPIAATAAVSQAKTPVEMIRPPSPEKSSKLVVALAITAGVLAIAAIGFTIYFVTTGKF